MKLIFPPANDLFERLTNPPLTAEQELYLHAVEEIEEGERWKRRDRLPIKRALSVSLAGSFFPLPAPLLSGYAGVSCANGVFSAFYRITAHAKTKKAFADLSARLQAEYREQWTSFHSDGAGFLLGKDTKPLVSLLPEPDHVHTVRVVLLGLGGVKPLYYREVIDFGADFQTFASFATNVTNLIYQNSTSCLSPAQLEKVVIYPFP